jgi:hypothetical protein
MIDLFEETQLGKLDPTHLGVWLNINPALNREDFIQLTPLMWKAFHLPLDTTHRSYVNSCPSEESAEFAVHCFTLFQHEARHYHDLLLTPYGSMLARQYTRAQLSYLYCRDDLFLRAKSIVVPISDWVENWELFDGVVPNIKRPPSTICQLHELIDTMMKKLVAFHNGNSGLANLAGGLNTTMILEGSAILVQEEIVSQMFGKNHFQSFRNGILSRPAGRNYYGAIDLVCKFLRTHVPAEVISYLLIASLCGNFQDPNPNHLRYPPDVLVELLIWLHQHNFDVYKCKSFDDVVHSVDKYFENKLGASLRDHLQQATIVNAKVTEAFEQMIQDIEIKTGSVLQSKDPQELIHGFKAFRSAQERMVELFIRDPLSYCSRLSYVQNQRSLPQPLIFIEAEQGIPISPELEKMYYIQNESMLDIGLLPDNISKQVYHMADKEGIIRAAHIISPKANPGVYGQSANAISLLQANFDRVSPLRLMIEGMNNGSSSKWQNEVVAAFNLVGTRIFTRFGEIGDGKPLPDKFASKFDPKGYMSQLRSIKKKNSD